ncbi:MAG TPA: hypothetical protein VF559_04630, partial [Caulobacteraceae bacterium]
MVAIVTGNGLGLERTSAWVLGSRGQVGQSGTGRAGENVYVNAATGNLVVENVDEILKGPGPDDVVTRTYNSLGTMNDDNGDNWRMGAARRVSNLAGTLGTAGSTVRRTDWDGGLVVYNWDDVHDAYVSTDGAGAYDEITYTVNAQGDVTTWTWTDGATLLKETYDAANSGRISASIDPDGKTLSFTYGANNLISQVTTETGEYTKYDYVGTLLQQITTGYYYADGAAAVPANTAITTRSRVKYTYDTQNRLDSVVVDLTPENSSDTQTYKTSYTYDGTSKRILSISQTDNSRLDFTYTSDFKIATVKETSAEGEKRTTSFNYATGTTLQTAITEETGGVTLLNYDGKRQLTRITYPAPTDNEASSTVQFGYNSNGDVTRITENGKTTYFLYDVNPATGVQSPVQNGLCTKQWDTLGNSVFRTYDSNNSLVTETRYVGSDPAASSTSPGSPTKPLTTRYVYDTENHLRYMVSEEGRVTQYKYSTAGRRTAEIEYVQNQYDVSTLTWSEKLTEAQLDGWLSDTVNPVDKGASNRTDFSYDYRGEISSTTTYERVGTTGNGRTDAEVSTTNYVYDYSGKLIARIASGYLETYSYDGLWRMKSTTDFNNVTTQIAYNDASNATVVTLASGLVQTSVYNYSGELIFYKEGPSDSPAAHKTSYAYDELGRLRSVTDPTGVKSNYLYDRMGRKVADVAADGSLTEYVYNTSNQLTRTVRYKTTLTATQMAQLSGFDTELGDVRPQGNNGDIWEWRFYDNAGRLTQVVDAEGAGTEYKYNGLSQLVSITSYATRLSASVLSGMKTSPPTAVQSFNSDTAVDRVQRMFYDDDANLVGNLDAEGYLSETKYDGAGQKIETIRYAKVARDDFRADGTFALLRSNVTNDNSDPAKDIHNYYFYDKRGYMTAAIDGEGDVTRYHYSQLGFVDQETRGQKIASDTFNTYRMSRPASLPEPSGTTDVLELTSYERDPYGQVTKEMRALASGIETTKYEYDSMRRLTATITALGTSDERTVTQRYDIYGNLTGQLNGVGSAALAVTGSVSDDVYKTYGTIYEYDKAGRLISKTTPNGINTAGNKTVYYYDTQNHLTHEVNALGEVTEYAYNGFGWRTQVVVHANALDLTQTSVSGGLATQGFLDAVAAIADDADSATQTVYNLTGTVHHVRDAEGAVTHYSHNAFREVDWRRDPIRNTNGNNPGAGTQEEIHFTRDRRGLITHEIRDYGTDPARLNLDTATTYDAFGRATQVTSPDGRVRKTEYDRAGRVLVLTDMLNADTGYTTTFEYDGRGMVLSRTDRSEAKTTFAYDAFSRTITATTELSSTESLITTTQRNAHGQTVSVTDAGLRTTTYAYDKNGNLKTVTNGELGVTLNNDYDKAGRIKSAFDAVNSKTTFSEYDAANRLQKITVDSGSGGLSLMTTFTFDHKGQVIEVVDPAQVKTRYDFDRLGRKTLVTVDPNGLAIKTLYEYDQASRTVTVTEGEGTSSARVTKYAYDRDGRLVTSSIDPDGLNLETEYAYDGDGNVLKKTDANGYETRYVYDGLNRLTYTVDAVGGVTKTTYDEEGRVLTKLAYDNVLTAATLTTLDGTVDRAATVSANLTLSADNDRLTSYAYDKAGRLKYVVDAERGLSAYNYDGSDNVVSLTRYTSLIDEAAEYSRDYIEGQIGSLSPTGNRISRGYFDGANRQIFSIDPAGAVIGYVYDDNGKVTRRTSFATLKTGPAPTLDELKSWTTTDQDRVERSLYDKAGRLVYSIDALNYVTKFTYDGDGRVTEERRYATKVTVDDTVTLDNISVTAVASKDVVNTYAYDTAGRLTGETRALGATSEGTTGYQLDALGNRVKVTDPNQNAGYFYYDGAGRLVMQVDPENYVTETRYYASGAVLQVKRYETPLASAPAVGTKPTPATDSDRDATTLITRDKLDRVTAVTDAEGYTETYVLNVFGERETVQSKLASDDTAANASKYQTKYEYDRVGRVTSETLPIKTTTTAAAEIAVVNTYAYNAFGNLRVKTEAEGAAEERVTNYGYDKAGRLVEKTGEAVSILELNADKTGFLTKNGVVPTETYAYDFRGNLIESTVKIDTASTARTLYYYDLADRRKAQIDPMGALTKWDYDYRGNAIKTYAYKTPVALPAQAGGAEPQPVSGDAFRQTTYGYDRRDRLTSTTVSGLTTATWSDAAGGSGSLATATTDIETANAYDAAGNLIRQTDGRGHTAYAYFDKAGRKVGEIDREGYYTRYWHDSDGNVTEERRYAVPIGGTPPSTLPTNPTTSGDDRVTSFTYDRNGRRLTEKRQGVNSYSLDSGNGLVDNSNASSPAPLRDVSVITYTYNGLGQVTSKTWGDDDVATDTDEKVNYKYDAIGRQTQVIMPGYMGLAGALTVGLTTTKQAVRPVTTYAYDGLNNVKTAEVSDFNGVDTRKRITTYTYGAGGRLTSIKDAAGFTRTFSYDAAGRTVRENYTRAKWDNYAAAANGAYEAHASTVVEAVNYRYDLAGRLTFQASATLSGATVSAWGDATWLSYNAYGDLTGKGVGKAGTPVYQESFRYDDGGRLLGANSGDGVWKYFLYDKNGNAVAEVKSNGDDISGWTSAADVTGALNADGTAVSAGVVGTFHRYDDRNQRVMTTEPGRGLAGTTTAHIKRSVTYNAFGEVVREYSGGAYTFHLYNSLGRLWKTVHPEAAYVDATGADQSGMSVDRFYYDVQGRLIGTRTGGTAFGSVSATGALTIDSEVVGANVTTRRLRAGTGLDGGEAVALVEHHADGGEIRTDFDVFGDARRITSEVGEIERRDYDAMGRLTRLKRPDRYNGTTLELAGLSERWAYDGLGQRILHWNSQLNDDTATANRLKAYEATGYDSQGRVTYMQDYGGVNTTTEYVYDTTTVTGVLLWRKTAKAKQSTAADAPTNSLVDFTDSFGRVRRHTDYDGSGHVYEMTYDRAGRLVSQDNAGTGKVIDYAYFNTGLLKTITDSSSDLNGFTTGKLTSTFGYDAQGRRTRETYTSGSGTGLVTYEDATASYDALGRMTQYLNKNGSNVTTADVDYAYDAAGNVRHVHAQYTPISGTLANSEQDYWYGYDSMNRMTLAKGVLSGGSIVRGDNGVNIGWDASGRRASVTRTVRWDEVEQEPGTTTVIHHSAAQTETYAYTDDGYLKSVTINDPELDSKNPLPGVGGPVVRARDVRDAMGRVTAHYEYDGFGNERYSRTAIHYDANSKILDEHVKTVRDDMVSEADSEYAYEAARGVLTGVTTDTTVTPTTGGSTTTHSSVGYTYKWWDTAQQETVTYDADTTDGVAGKTTTYNYDANGHLRS